MRNKVAKKLRKQSRKTGESYDFLKKQHKHVETKVWIMKTKRQMRLAICILFVLFSTSCFAQKKIKPDSTLHVHKKDSIINLKLVMPVQDWNGLLQLIKTADEKPSTIKAYTEFIMNNLKKDEKEN